MSDSDADDAFLDDVNKALAGRTVIMISHHPEAIQRAGMLVKIQDGKATIETSPQPGSLDARVRH